MKRPFTAVFKALITSTISLSPTWLVYIAPLKLVSRCVVLILTRPIITLLLNVWMLMAVFEDLPKKLHGAAMVNGTTPFGVFGGPGRP